MGPAQCFLAILTLTALPFAIALLLYNWVDVRLFLPTLVLLVPMIASLGERRLLCSHNFAASPSACCSLRCSAWRQSAIRRPQAIRRSLIARNVVSCFGGNPSKEPPKNGGPPSS